MDTRSRTNGELPIVVDHSALILTEPLVESFFALLASRPNSALAAVRALRNGKAEFKSKLADGTIAASESLPLDQEVVAFLQAEKAKGRRVYLASGSDMRRVDGVVEYLGVFDGILSLDGTCDPSVSADRLCEVFGDRGFDYVGRGQVDEQISRRTRILYITETSPARVEAARAWALDVQAIGARRNVWREYVRALRPHQWLKNLLIFAPALAAHRADNVLFAAFIAFVSLSLCASSLYILNDLIDLRNDRAHPRKRFRPFAAGRIPLAHGIILVPGLLLVSIALGLFLPFEFVLVLIGYAFLSCAYSLALKRRMIVDVVTLACLYGSRLAAGAAATAVPLSPWLIALALFLFFSLALMKRWAELADHLTREKGDPLGRGYQLDDLPVIRSMATASGYVSVLVLALYINGDAGGVLYRHPDRLWLNCVLLLFWVSRMIMVTHRGRMHDDPLVFAATDRISQLVVLSGAIITLSAIF
jgi:4-hydroxybenzoate polyprenyltransferase